mmetsp:Transcript_8242/g.17573  ORF Transcript_8242/g.17573 Transcript_8242/m.17573 type:complete len:131 (+) Transcript_8242:323-715(+)|eukprot:CAMPEP_0171329544 /NCGR_PEP_ID=MMETSP0878-20121228/1363_1 /TAXON_ID=67004 /ORGANISM="Thalassiosira weissflogii, Strain CCMP1336" /LENGTH=130 /DNA_ID=CAMNT_0011829591 /DNA_START=222 /DNA_END=614 /DNA_ORIENTATION=+
MAFKPTDANFSFEPIDAQDMHPNTPTEQAVPSLFASGGFEPEEEDPSDTAIMVGCGLVGCLLGGPFWAILAALGGTYAAGRNKGPVGESSKAVGRIAVVAGKKASEEHLFCKMKDSVSSLFKKRASTEKA